MHQQSISGIPKITVDTQAIFGISVPFEVHGFQEPSLHTPVADTGYVFDPTLTKLILAGFAFNRRVYVQGLHGTGKSSHIEQIAARLHWPCLRINLDSHISRADLIGRDIITLKDHLQITEFQEGLLVWALQHPTALVLDEYDAGRPDVLFVLQRLLETSGKLTLLDQNRVIEPHADFRLFATANTAGMGDTTGLYQGTQLLNHGQLDRWQIMATLNFMPAAAEIKFIENRLAMQHLHITLGMVASMVDMAGLIRDAFISQALSTLMSPRTVLAWAENSCLLQDSMLAFQVSYLNRCDAAERPLVAEFYQRVFAQDLPAHMLAEFG